MDRERLLFRAMIDVPYTVDIDNNPDIESEDGMLHICFTDEIDIANMSCYGEDIGIPIHIIEQKLKEFDLTYSEYSSALSYFVDNSSCDNEDYIIIKYDELHFNTGVKDVNGNVIYEGDIVKVLKDPVFTGEYDIRWKHGAFVLGGDISIFAPIYHHDLEIIGTSLRQYKEVLI